MYFTNVYDESMYIILIFLTQVRYTYCYWRRNGPNTLRYPVLQCEHARGIISYIKRVFMQPYHLIHVM